MENNDKRVVGTYLFTAISTMILIVLWEKCPDSYDGQYFCLLCCHIFMCINLFNIVSKNRYYIFEPIVFVFFMYYMIFVFTPIYNIFTDNMDVFGTNTMNGCVKATIIFVLGFVALVLGYYSKIYIRGRVKRYWENYNNSKVEYEKNSLLLYSYLVWSGAVGVYLLYNMMTGRNILYMLSFGFLSQGLNNTQNYSVDFLSMIIYCSFLPMMNILIYGRSKFIKIFVFLITCIPVATRGFRSVLIIPMLAPLIYHYVKKKEKPKLRVLIVAILLIFFMLGFIANTRGSMRIGNGLNMDGYSYSDGIDGALDYFGSYKAFYGAVTKYPSIYSYTFGQQLLYAIIMYIPRAIWPGKPGALIQEVIGNSTNEIARKSGFAWPNIGEYYTDAGVIGVVLIMFMLGVIFRKMKGMYENSTQSSVIAYSLLLPGLIPIIAYGYTAGNLPSIVFMLLPFLGQRFFVKRKVFHYRNWGEMHYEE